MNGRLPALLTVTAALAGLALLVISAPDYLPRLGYPLDDAWIHAVYGRAIARDFSLSYNPGVPATGSTSPLWGVLLALPHLAADGVEAIVLATKLMGFVLHILTALTLLVALGPHRPGALGGAILVAIHPDLVSASVSGMEVPLATLAAAALLFTALQNAWIAYACVSALAVQARPELAVLCAILPPLLYFDDRRRVFGLWIAGGLGLLISFGALAARNLIVSGFPLPATYYAKVGATPVPIAIAIWAGFSEQLAYLSIAGLPVFLAVGFGLAAARLFQAQPPLRADAASLLAGAAFCAVSFVLVPPIDPEAFYHQRYVLPALPLILAAIPSLADMAAAVLSRPVAAFTQLILVAFLTASALLTSPGRYRHLANDASNIDEVQVAVGRSLANANASDVLWAVDAGAVRYFGAAYVVDLLGLNSSALNGPRAQEYLDSHPPHYLDLVPTWTGIMVERDLAARMFQPSRPYTVTSSPGMRQHWLVSCRPAGTPGRVEVRARQYGFQCAPDLPALAGRRSRG